MGELTTTGGLGHLTSAEAQNAFLQAGDDMDMGGGSAFGKFSGNDGSFTYGQNDEELEHGELVAFDMSTAFRGWTLWMDGKPEDEIMVKVIDGSPPRESQLEDCGPYDDGEGWSPLSGCGIIVVEDGTPVLLKLTSRSAASAFGKLLKDYGRQLAKHPGEFPVIEIGAVEFQPKKKSYGKKWAPTFEIVDWISPDKLAEGAMAEEDASNYEESEEEDEDQGIPVKEGSKAKTAGKASKAKSKAKEEDEDEDKPKRRRRRRNV